MADKLQKPSLCRIVLFHFKDEAGLPLDGKCLPAMITRVHTDSCVNLAVFPDGHGPKQMMGVMSVQYDEAGENSHLTCSWSWPPRV